MSHNLLRLIPADPGFQPAPAAVDEAFALLREQLPPASYIQLNRSDEIQFVDQGGNFERVLCPNCSQDLTSQWSAWMDESHRSQFRIRTIKLPCCKREADLNDLTYEWPAGFADIAFEVQHPQGQDWLHQRAHQMLEQVLRCRIKQILARY